eukprot:gene40289-53256_t
MSWDWEPFLTQISRRLSDAPGVPWKQMPPARASVLHGAIQECLDARVAVVVAEELCGWRVERDLTLVEEHHAVRHIAGKAHFMGHHDHRHARSGELAHDVEDFLDHLGVKSGSRLVEQHHARARHHRAAAAAGVRRLLPRRGGRHPGGPRPRHRRDAAAPERHIHLIVENEDNCASLLDGASPSFDAQWNDDGHHCLHVLLTGEHEGYYADYAVTPAEKLARCLAEGF